MRLFVTAAAAALLAFPLAACSSGSSSTASAARYSSAAEVVAALKHGHLPCAGGDDLTPVVKGATAETLCNFTPDETGLIDVFPGNVSNATVLQNSVSTGSQQIFSDVGPNWWVQASHAYAKRVQAILGGRIVAGPWHPPGQAAAPDDARSYADVQALTDAMAAGGASCSNITLSSGGTVTGEVNPFAGCDGTTAGDTAILVFTDHADAVAYAHSMINVGEETGDQAAEVIGPNWTVNTGPVFAAKVLKAIGGQLLTGPPVAGASAGPESPAPAAEPTMTRQSDVVVFRVSGTGYPSILYGSDSDNRSPKGGYGALGDGNVLPWKASLAYDSGALYYAVTAQLEGSGDISDSVTEVVTTWCSDGSKHTERFPLASGHASGGYSIARAEYASGDTGNAAQAESDAGC